MARGGKDAEGIGAGLMIRLVPPDDGIEYPTLGPQVVDWMHENLCFGPGDLRGEPLRLDEEQQGFIWKFYELFPKGHPLGGRRRFRRCALSLAKGLRKTELGACIAAAELHPDAPVRFNGWSGKGLKTGRGVTDPFVVLVAYTEEQSDELAYGALKAILEEAPIGRDFDIGLERIMRRQGGGKAVSLAGSPNARDGARTTFQLFDETHWMTLPRLKQGHQTMMANLPKRKLADAWALEITTAPEPGTGSIAEATMEYANAVADGQVRDASLFYFHRQASDEHDLTTEAGARAAVIEASGISAAWRDIDAIVALWRDPTTDRQYWERVWCNRLVKGSAQAFDVEQWKSLERKDVPVKDGDFITLGFDGSVFHDATGLVATHIRTGYQWVIGLWECPPSGKTPNGEPWQVPTDEVEAIVQSTFEQYRVWRMYADPPYWRDWLAKWAGADWSKDAEGKPTIIEWWTNQRKKMTYALENYTSAMKQGLVCHGGDKRLMRHLGNARRQDLLNQLDEQGKPLWLIRKERSDSPHKIDLAMAACLSWEARTHAVSEGMLDATEPTYNVFVFGGGR